MLNILFRKKTEISLPDEDSDDHWNSLKETELPVDIYERPDALIVQSLVAGVVPDELDVSIQNDLLTIRGMREMPEIVPDDLYYARECVWGAFRRTVVIPIPVRPEAIRAFCKNGIVTIELPKLSVDTAPSLEETDEDDD